MGYGLRYDFPKISNKVNEEFCWCTLFIIIGVKTPILTPNPFNTMFRLFAPVPKLQSLSLGRTVPVIGNTPFESIREHISC